MFTTVLLRTALAPTRTPRLRRLPRDPLRPTDRTCGHRLTRHLPRCAPADRREAIDQVPKHAPDVVLMDIRMPVLDGLEATRRLLANAADHAPKIVILTTLDLDEHVYEALRAGASGFLLKDVPAHQLVHAIRVTAAGDALLAPSVTRRLIASPAPLHPKPAHARTS